MLITYFTWHLHSTPDQTTPVHLLTAKCDHRPAQPHLTCHNTTAPRAEPHHPSRTLHCSFAAAHLLVPRLPVCFLAGSSAVTNRHTHCCTPRAPVELREGATTACTHLAAGRHRNAHCCSLGSCTVLAGCRALSCSSCRTSCCISYCRSEPSSSCCCCCCTTPTSTACCCMCSLLCLEISHKCLWVKQEGLWVINCRI